MQQIDQNDPGQSIIGDYGDQIVYGCDQRPDATAGSTPIFWKKIGITVPNKEEISMASIMAAPRHPETAKAKDSPFPFKTRYPPITRKEDMPRIKPLVRPTRDSFRISVSFCFPEVCLS